MMNSLSSRTAAEEPVVPVSPFDYRDMNAQAHAVAKPTKAPDEGKKQDPPGPTPEQINLLLSRARAEGAAEAEKRLRAEYDAKAAAEAAKVAHVLEMFVSERKSYFSRVEADVVKLALAIAAKILHREAQVDPLLMTALVRVAIERMQDGSKVSVRVAPQEVENWRKAFAKPLNSSVVTIVEDMHLAANDCILETDLGSANFSIDSQLKEIEQGFFDLLAQRPS